MKKTFILALLLVSQTLLAASDDAAVRAALRSINPGVQPSSVTPSSVNGLYEVVNGPRLFYVTSDGKYMIQGDVIDIKKRENITEARRVDIRVGAVDAIGEDKMIIFAPEKTDHTITVFTDIDCGYCRKLHGEMDELNALGIKVRYLFYPRSGVNTSSYYKAVTVWCSDDQKQALTDSKSGVTLPRKDCSNPVKQHMAMGEMLGVSGTPTILLENGRIIPGYVPAKRLLKIMEKER
ncbi:MAG: thioredoxin fold domain-containing protein [Gammaproteobacteria bacterium]|nr:thioredoxin fold domain-containing protein [Gammaproteobacteria bacterium]